MKSFMIAQKKRIEVDKWYEGCRIQKDPGKSYILNWIENNAAQFREAWEKSVCRECPQSLDCGHEVVRDCNYFKNNQR
jgi:hypothetical protein